MSTFWNRILKVDLSTSTFTEETFDDKMVHDYIGGRGFGVKMLYDLMKPGTDPLGEDNLLVFVAGLGHVCFV